MEEMNLKSYAYIGDAVWELFVREIMVQKTQNAKELHKITTAHVNAVTQHKLLSEIENFLTEEELELLRRGRNLSVPIARKSNQSDYRMATAFEVLIGWWYKTNQERLIEIKKILKENLEKDFTKKNQ